jgi:outer membrane protein
MLGAASLGWLAATGALNAVTAESLNQALSATYQYNPQIDAQRARLRATDEQVAIAMSGYRPKINANGDINWQHQTNRPFSIADGVTRPAGYSVDLVQPIFTGLQTTNAVRAAEATVRAGRQTLRDTERTVFLQAVTAYMDVVRDQTIVKLQENNVQVLSRELKATQDRFAVGEVTKTDVAQAEARRAGAVSQLDLARANLKTSRASYEQVVGHPASNVAEPALPARLLPRNLDDAVGTSARENPLVVAALYNEEAGRYQVDQIRGALLPQLQFEANWTDRFEPGKFTDETKTATVTGRMTVPIYEGGQVYAQVRQAKHTHLSLLQTIELTRSQVQQAVTAAWSQMQAARAQVQSDQVQVAANQTALTGVREEERVGQRTLLDVLNAEQELLNSQVNLQTDKRNLVVAAYSLLSQIGRLDASMLNVASDIYDPEIHYEEVRRQWWGLSITHADGRREFMDLWPTRVDHEPTK